MQCLEISRSFLVGFFLLQSEKADNALLPRRILSHIILEIRKMGCSWARIVPSMCLNLKLNKCLIKTLLSAIGNFVPWGLRKLKGNRQLIWNINGLASALLFSDPWHLAGVFAGYQAHPRTTQGCCVYSVTTNLPSLALPKFWPWCPESSAHSQV